MGRRRGVSLAVLVTTAWGFVTTPLKSVSRRPVSAAAVADQVLILQRCDLGSEAAVAHELALLLRERDAVVRVVRDGSRLDKRALKADAVDAKELREAGVEVFEADDLNAAITNASFKDEEWCVVDGLSRCAADVGQCADASKGAALYALISTAEVYAAATSGEQVDEAAALVEERPVVGAEKEVARRVGSFLPHGYLVFRGAATVASRGCLGSFAMSTHPLCYFFRRVRQGRSVPLPYWPLPSTGPAPEGAARADSRRPGDVKSEWRQRLSLSRASDAAETILAALTRPAEASEARVYNLGALVHDASLSPPTYSDIARCATRAARKERLRTPFYNTTIPADASQLTAFMEEDDEDDYDTTLTPAQRQQEAVLFGGSSTGRRTRTWSRLLKFPFADVPMVLDVSNTERELLLPLDIKPANPRFLVKKVFGGMKLSGGNKGENDRKRAAADDARLMAAIVGAYDAFAPWAPEDDTPAPVIDPTQPNPQIDPTSPFAADELLEQKGGAQRGSMVYLNNKINFPLGPSRDEEVLEEA